MAKFRWCWHKPPSVEEVERGRIETEWLGNIAWGRLDVLKLKGAKPYILDSSGKWSRLPRHETAKE